MAIFNSHQAVCNSLPEGITIINHTLPRTTINPNGMLGIPQDSPAESPLFVVNGAEARPSEWWKSVELQGADLVCSSKANPRGNEQSSGKLSDDLVGIFMGYIYIYM